MILDRRPHRWIALSLAVLLALLLTACGTSPRVDAEPRGEGLSPAVIRRLNPQPPSALEPRPARPLQPVQPPLDTSARPRLTTLATDTDEVRMSVLVIGTVAGDPALHAWEVLLQQAGVPYEVLLAASEPLTAELLVGPDSVGRFQAVLLTTANLGYEVSPDVWQSAFTWDEWNLLWQYERDFGVRQVVLYGSPSTWPEDLGIEKVGEGTATSASPATLRPTTAGAAVFDDLATGAAVPVPMESDLPLASGGTYSVYVYRSRLTADSTAVPLLEDAAGNVLAVTSTAPDGRERLMLTFDQAAYEGVPLLHTQLLGHDLIQWATKGVHLGDHRLHLGADVDDWFIATDLWDTATQSLIPDGFTLSAADADATADQQLALRSAHPVADDLTWTIAYNGQGADPDATSSCDPGTATLSAMTKCLAGHFRWLNHTWSHAYMDSIAGVYEPTYQQIYDEIEDDDDIVDDFGFGPTFAPKSLVTGDISGLGWYATPPDSEPKVDHGLEASNPDLLQAAAALGRDYIASNMSTPSHEPDGPACGIVHPLNDDILLVPRWPTNVFYSVSTPAAALETYNLLYSAEQDGSQGYYSRDLTFDEYLAAETDIALRHVLSGEPYPHYFHIANLHEHAPGRSLLYDWSDRLLDRYGDAADLPLLSPAWDDLGGYVGMRTSYADAGASGVWDRAAGTVTITTTDAGTVFATGAELHSTNRLSYGGRLISWRTLSAGQTVTVSGVPGDPPPTPEYRTLTTSVDGQGSVTGGGDYLFYETATVTATPATGWRFDHWVIDAGTDPADWVHENPTTLEMTVDRWATASFTEKLAQTITFEAIPDKVTTDPPFDVTVGASSDLPVTLTAAGPCTASGTTITLTGAGTCILTASQAGNDDYLPADDVQQSFQIAKAQQTITFPPLANRTTANPPFDVIVSASSGLPVSLSAEGVCTVSGTTVTLTGDPGRCSITASQAGNDTYLPAADVSRSFQVRTAKKPRHAVTVHLHGSGFGVVVSSPVGLYTTRDGAASFEEGTTVTLVAVPLPGSTFAGWSGACGGHEGCQVQLDEDAVVHAVFELEE